MSRRKTTANTLTSRHPYSCCWICMDHGFFPGSALVFSYYLLLLKGVSLHPFFILSSPAVKRKDISGLSVNRLLFYFYSPSFISTAAEKVSRLFSVWCGIDYHSPIFFSLCHLCPSTFKEKKNYIYIFFSVQLKDQNQHALY